MLQTNQPKLYCNQILMIQPRSDNKYQFYCGISYNHFIQNQLIDNLDLKLKDRLIPIEQSTISHLDHQANYLHNSHIFLFLSEDFIFELIYDVQFHKMVYPLIVRKSRFPHKSVKESNPLQHGYLLLLGTRDQVTWQRPFLNILLSFELKILRKIQKRMFLHDFPYRFHHIKCPFLQGLC